MAESFIGVEELRQFGVKIGAKVAISPMLGRKRTTKIQRTKVDLLLGASEECEISPVEIKLPQVGIKKDQYELSLESLESHEGLFEVFRLKSRTGTPFRVNGTYTFNTFLHEGDKVDIGYNRFEFLRQERNDLDLEDNLLSKDIVESDLNVLIEGETGTGKSRLAKKIHEESGRIGSFIHINLSSFSLNLLESELFGHIKGSFTGAVNDKTGAFFQANNGTLFLDEIDSLPIEIQTKLLLFFDSKRIRPVGSMSEKFCNVRVVIASGSDLKGLVKSKKMRSDFYFRLKSGVSIKLKSLRNDPLKTDRICEQFSIDQDVLIPPKLVKFYRSMYWPGNIRQLVSHLYRKKIITKGRVFNFDECEKELLFECELSKEIIRFDESMTFKEFKKNYFYNSWMRFDKDVNLTAKTLNVSANTIRSILKDEILLAG